MGVKLSWKGIEFWFQPAFFTFSSAITADYSNVLSSSGMLLWQSFQLPIWNFVFKDWTSLIQSIIYSYAMMMMRLTWRLVLNHCVLAWYFLLQSLVYLGELVGKIAQFDLLNWFGRVKLIDCICNFILLSPEVGQVIIFYPSPIECLSCFFISDWTVKFMHWLK